MAHQSKLKLSDLISDRMISDAIKKEKKHNPDFKLNKAQQKLVRQEQKLHKAAQKEHRNASRRVQHADSDDSECFSDLKYNPRTGLVTATFRRDGSVYQYDLPKDIWAEWRDEAPDLGVWFNKELR